MSWEWVRAERVSLASFVVDAPGRWITTPHGDAPSEVPQAPRARRTIAASAYDTLARQRLTYDGSAPFDPRAVGRQVVRDPRRLLTDARSGTCLDLSLLYAGMLLVRGLIPYLAVVQGHALVLVSTTHESRDHDVPDRPGRAAALAQDGLLEPDQIRRLVADGHLLPVDCTGFAEVTRSSQGLDHALRTDGLLSFDHAVDLGRRILAEKEIHFGVDICTARWDHGVLPRPLPDEPVDERLAPYDFRHGAAQRPVFHDPDDDTSPDRIFGLLRGGRTVVQLAGPPGSGMSRLCYETALRAQAADWQVLTADLDRRDPTLPGRDGSLTEAVLSRVTSGTRTLVVLDNPDTIALTEEELVRLTDRVEDGSEDERDSHPSGDDVPGTRLAVLVTVRGGPAVPGGTGPGQSVGGPRTLRVRLDAEYGARIADAIIRLVAPDALAQLSMTEMRERCGGRPGFALTAALQEQAAIREAGGPSPGVVVGSRQWRYVRQVLQRQRLIPMPPRDPLSRAEAAPRVLVFAAVAATAPADEEALVRTADRAIEALGSRELPTGQAFVDELVHDLGLLTLSASRPTTVRRGRDSAAPARQDVAVRRLEPVTATLPAVLLNEVFFPLGQQEIDRRAAQLLFDVAAANPRALGWLGARVAAAHDQFDATRQKAVAAVCAEWVHEHAASLGAMLDGPDSGRALYTLLHHTPWREPVLAEWNAVVQPWFGASTPSRQARLLAEVLTDRHDDDRMRDRVRIALVWLAGDLNADRSPSGALRPETKDNSDAYRVLHRLLKVVRKDEQYAKDAVAYALHWLAAHPASRSASFVLVPLLGHRLTAEQSAEVTDKTLDRLEAVPAKRRDPAAGRIICALLRHHREAGGQRTERMRRLERVVGRWLLRHEALPEAGFLFQALLDGRQVFTGIDDPVDRCLQWLGRHTPLPSAPYVLKALVSPPSLDLTPAQALRLCGHVMNWHRENPGHDLTPVILSRTVGYSDIDEQTATRMAETVLAWLDDTRRGGGVPSAAGYALANILGNRRVDPAVTETTVREALEWLREYPLVDAAAAVIQSLQRCQPTDPEILVPVCRAALAWVHGNLNQRDARLLLRDLPEALDRWPADAPETWGHAPRAETVLLALDWVACNPQCKPVALLGKLVRGSGLLGAPLRRHLGDSVFALLPGLLGQDDAHRLLEELRHFLERSEAVEDVSRETARLWELSLDWVEAHPGAQATGLMCQRMLTTLPAQAKEPDRGRPAPLRRLIEASLGWLIGHIRQRSAGYLIRMMLSLPLTDEEREALTKHIHNALDHHPYNFNTLLLRRHMLRHQNVTEDVDGRTSRELAVMAEDWLEEEGAPYYLQALLKRTDLDLADVAVLAERALEWVRDNPESSAGAAALSEVLAHRGDLAPELCDRAVAQAVTWLGTNSASSHANNVVYALLERTDLGSRAAECLALGHTVLTEFRGHEQEPGLLWVLLVRADLSADVATSTLGRTLEWLDEVPDSAKRWLVLSALLRRLDLVPDDRREQLVDEAVEWLRDHPTEEQAGNLIEVLLALDDLSRVRELLLRGGAAEWLSKHGDGPGPTPFVARALLRRPGLPAAETARMVALLANWLTGLSPVRHTSGYCALSVLLPRSDLPDDARTGVLRCAVSWLARFPHSAVWEEVQDLVLDLADRDPRAVPIAVLHALDVPSQDRQAELREALKAL